MAHRVPILLMRWMCRHCRKTFRQYPHFLEPSKRFITPTITLIVEKVIKSPRKRYDDAVKTEGPNKIPHFYRDSDKRLSPTTCWRWITWVALVMAKTLSSQPTVATEDTAQKFGAAEEFFHPNQAQSPERFAELYSARRLILDRQHWPPTIHRERNRMF